MAPTWGPQNLRCLLGRMSTMSVVANEASGIQKLADIKGKRLARSPRSTALGYRLDEVPNDITRVTPASFEPTIDYVVVKIPRWNFEKFPQADRTLTTQMKSVGEAMAIGRTFKEAFLKGVRSLELGREGLLFKRPDEADEEPSSKEEEEAALRRRLVIPNDRRMWALFRALDLGWDVDTLHELTNIDPWFLQQFKEMVELRKTAQLGEYRPKLVRYLATGKGAADVTALEEGILNEFKANPRNWADLTPLVADHSKEYLPWKWELGKAPDGRLIGLPTDVGSLAVCYRKDLFQAAGLPTERAQVSTLWPDWKGFHEAGRRYKQGSGGKAFGRPLLAGLLVVNLAFVGTIAAILARN